MKTNRDKGPLEKLFSNRKHWIKGFYAKTGDGCRVRWNHPKAECFCFSGAMLRTHGYPPIVIEALYHMFKSPSSSIRPVAGLSPITIESVVIHWNDSKERTFRDVKVMARRVDTLFEKLKNLRSNSIATA